MNSICLCSITHSKGLRLFSPFVGSPDILRILGIAQRYKVRPSELMGTLDEYTAYCFDEACAYIMLMMDSKEEPMFHTRYRSFSDLYAQYK